MGKADFAEALEAFGGKSAGEADNGFYGEAYAEDAEGGTNGCRYGVDF